MQQILLLHGALGSPQYFDFIKSNLGSKYDVHTPTLLGHAGNNDQDIPLTIANYVNQIEAYVLANNLNNFVIFGYSMGGYIGLNYATKFPDKVKAVVTLATKFAWNPEVAQKEALFLQPAIILEKVPKYAQVLSKMHGDSWQNLVENIAELLLQLGQEPNLNKSNLSKIVCPVQVMVGAQDNMVSIEETKQLADQIKNSSIKILPDTIHPFEKIDQELLVDLLNNFLVKL